MAQLELPSPSFSLQLTFDAHKSGLLLHAMVLALAGQDQMPDLQALDLCG